MYNVLYKLTYLMYYQGLLLYALGTIDNYMYTNKL